MILNLAEAREAKLAAATDAAIELLEQLSRNGHEQTNHAEFARIIIDDRFPQRTEQELKQGIEFVVWVFKDLADAGDAPLGATASGAAAAAQGENDRRK